VKCTSQLCAMGNIICSAGEFRMIHRGLIWAGPYRVSFLKEKGLPKLRRKACIKAQKHPLSLYII
jgi:hypothetical protein